MQTIEHENQNLIRAGYPPLADTETLHTPGPWLAVVTDTTCGGEPAIWEITDKHGGVIAEDISHNPANASLIAAAPDMFDALQAIVDYMETAKFPIVDLMTEAFVQDSLLIDQCKAALAKATA